jgi:hypothetical protein
VTTKISSKPLPQTAARPRLRGLVLTLGGLSSLLLLVWWPGCRQYPAVSSKEGLYLMKLLYSATNTKDNVRLTKVEEGVEKAARAGALTPPEQAAFAKIIGMARNGDWANAENSAFRFAQDQVNQGHAAPKNDEHRHEHKRGARRTVQR